MALSVDPFRVFAAIASNQEAFLDIKNDIEKAAKGLAEKSLKSTKLDVDKLNDIRSAFSDESLALILEGLPQRALKTICKRLDRHNENFKRGAPDPTAIWLRGRILTLARKEEAPVEKPKKASSVKPKKTAKTVGNNKRRQKRTPAKIGERDAVYAVRRREAS